MTGKHKCDRENCPPNNVSGPKSVCAKCKQLCFLKCFGFQQSEGVNDNETVKIKTTDGNIVYAYVAHIAFVCCDDSLSTSERKKAMKLPTTRANSKTRQMKSNDSNETKDPGDQIVISSILSSIKQSLDDNSKQLKSIEDNTNVLVARSTKQVGHLKHMNHQPLQQKIISGNFSLNNTPKSSFTHGPTSFADTVRNNILPNSAKRQRTDASKSFVPPAKSSKFEAPKPRMGTKLATTRLNVIEKPKPIEKPVFNKAIWISGFNPMTTTEEIIEYIVSETSVKEKSKFNVHKLVKKGQDMSALRYVSFKIEVNEEDFAVLCEPDAWEANVFVREFLQNKTLGDFFPLLNSKNNRTSISLEEMEVVGSQSLNPENMKSPNSQPNNIPNNSQNQ